MIFEWIKTAKQLLYKNGKNVEEALDEVNSNLEELPKTKLISGGNVLEVEENGKYYLGQATGLPDGVMNYGYLDVHVYDDTGSNRKITWTPVNSNKTYINIKASDTWTGWDSYALNSKSKDVILNNITDKDTHSIDISQYKKLVIRAVFANGGGTYQEVDVDVLKLFGTMVFALSNASPSGVSNYYGCMQITLTLSSCSMTEQHGTGVTGVHYTLYGIK